MKKRKMWRIEKVDKYFVVSIFNHFTEEWNRGGALFGSKSELLKHYFGTDWKTASMFQKW